MVEFTCDACKKSFGWRRAYEIHRKTHSNVSSTENASLCESNMKYLCIFCGKLFSNKSMLLIHIRELHEPNLELNQEVNGKSNSKVLDFTKKLDLKS